MVAWCHCDGLFGETSNNSRKNFQEYSSVVLWVLWLLLDERYNHVKCHSEIEFYDSSLGSCRAKVQECYGSLVCCWFFWRGLHVCSSLSKMPSSPISLFASWNLHLRRNLRDFKIDGPSSLLDILCSHHPIPSKPDTARSLSPNGHFLVSSIFSPLSSHPPPPLHHVVSCGSP